MARPGDPREPVQAEVGARDLPPLPARPAATTDSPAKAVPRAPADPGRADMAREAGRKGGQGSRRRETGLDDLNRRLGSVQGDLTSLRNSVDGQFGGLDDRLRAILDERLRPVEDLLRQIVTRLDAAPAAAAPSAPEPTFADPAKVTPITNEQYARAVKAWTNQLIRNPGAPFAEQANAVLAALTSPSGVPDLTLRRAVAAAGVYTFARHFSSGYPQTLALADVERLDDEIMQNVPDATALTEVEYEKCLELGIKER
jgi:hypothetical protein